jgi:peptidoglycan hydrolase-like protein with peptidoglycan-binding domain
VNRPLRAGLVVGVVGLVTAAGAAAAIGFGGGPEPTAGTGPTLSTTPVTRTSLATTQRVNGTLDYGAPVTVNGRGNGMVTWLPALGSVIHRGRPAYRADNRPVTLFYGNLPLYRQLRAGHIGDDVKEVERNLVALGYAGLTVDRRYTTATATAVREWQKDTGRTRTGVFDPADVVLAAAKLRVASIAAHLGDPADGPVLTYTGTARMVRIALDVALQNLVKRGITATVTLPTGKTVDGTVASVGSVATAAPAATGGAATGPATIEVIVTVPNQSVLGTLDQAPVVVELVSASVRNVLTVPVAALVAFAEGGYGVQVMTGPASRFVAVRLGMFADGRVQITGEGIAEGTLVAVPA